MRVLFVLPGFHRTARGAEIALMSIAHRLARMDVDTTLFGSGESRSATSYRYHRIQSLDRRHFASLPCLPVFRDQFVYEELTFLPALLRRYDPRDYDVTVTCSYPFVNWVLFRRRKDRVRPPHVFVTQNGDWPASSDQSEYRWFGCDGLVCINPEHFARNRDRWHCALIPNGVDTTTFVPGSGNRRRFSLPPRKKIVLMVSALTENKRVDLGVRTVAAMDDVHLVVAGDGPLRNTIEKLAQNYLPGRFTRLTVSHEEMPLLYQSADALLHLTRDEPFGNVFLEAMACGLPIVAQESARLRWIVGEAPRLFARDEPPSITSSLRRALSGTTNQTPQSHLDKFSWDRIAIMYKDFFEEIASKSRRS